MSYLQPPPNPSPVVVVKDVGGYVNEYAAQTEIYRQTNREVRLHECRSACTMALSLPNVCVYPDSILKFHQAYDPRNHATNYGVSDQLFGTYPPAVRARLGTLTHDYHVLRGSELIGLGIRDCNTPQGPRIMVAAATLKPLPETMTSGGPGLSSLTGKLEGMMSVFNTPAPTLPRTQGAPPPEKKPVPSELLLTQIPLPPTRPASIEVAKAELVTPDASTVAPADDTFVPFGTGGMPTPPKKPVMLVAYTPSLAPIPFMRKIDGAAAILPTKFVPFEKAKI
ncbi:hypothetical protein [Beijerinckia sp. L45]|uniref:hypothetical protein n=1 Tax=Beijerinckia sp. L45 TaxID=1641855 RepID=UPI001AEDCA0D|nr:hypothetical protein [Beijerinckia sp. L45]